MFSILVAFLALHCFAPLSVAQENGSRGVSSFSKLHTNRSLTASLPVNFAVVLYPGFQALDIFGPVDALNMLSLDYPINLFILGPTLDPVTTEHDNSHIRSSNISQQVVPTHSYDNPPEDIDVLFVPGGFGSLNNQTFYMVSDFIRVIYPKVDYLIAACTGAAIVADAGVLEGKNATGNKASWEWVISHGTNVNWISHARWVADGNIWTTSGVSAGTDGMFAFIADKFGEDEAEYVAVEMEYKRETNSTNDPFADYYHL
jgi:transcriptional regulator GlxA family with amidase domain